MSYKAEPRPFLTSPSKCAACAVESISKIWIFFFCRHTIPHLAALNRLHAGARLCLALAHILVGLGGVRVEAVRLAVRFADVVVARAVEGIAVAGHASGEVTFLEVLAALGDLATHEHVDDTGVDDVGADEEGEDGGDGELHLVYFRKVLEMACGCVVAS